MNLRPRRQACPRFINLTALIDVVFNLLLFFMVTTSFTQKTEIHLELPTADSAESAHAENNIEVSIDAQGRYHLQGETLPDQSLPTIRTALQGAASLSGSKEPWVVIDADGLASHQSVVTVMDAARQVGLTHLTFATRPSAVHSPLTH